jgi:hypothetical protein
VKEQKPKQTKLEAARAEKSDRSFPDPESVYYPYTMTPPFLLNILLLPLCTVSMKMKYSLPVTHK